MTPTFRISDALRCILLNAPKEPNLACPRESSPLVTPHGRGAASLLPRNTKLWKEILAQRPNRVTLIWWDGIRLGALASAASRAGSRVWEIDYLYLPVGANGRTPSPIPHSPPLVSDASGSTLGKGPFSSPGKGGYRRVHFNGRWNYGPDTRHLELLEHLVQAAGQRRAERIFLRVSSDDPIIDLARRVGFFPYFEETLLVGTSGAGARPAQGQASTGQASQSNGASPPEARTAHSIPGETPPAALKARQPESPTPEAQPATQGHHPVILSAAKDLGAGQPVFWHSRRPEDDYSLFQLFCATTPSQVRVALGLTFDQWEDARERQGQARREWVAERNGKLTGWLSLLSRRRVEEGEIMVHPDYPDLLPALIDLALARGGSQSWLVPDYQEPVRDYLRHHSFHEVARYTMLVKTVAAPVTSHGMIPMEA